MSAVGRTGVITGDTPGLDGLPMLHGIEPGTRVRIAEDFPEEIGTFGVLPIDGPPHPFGLAWYVWKADVTLDPEDAFDAALTEVLTEDAGVLARLERS